MYRVAVVALIACSSKDTPSPTPSAATVVATPTFDAPPLIDAAPPAPPARLVAYLDLLSLDIDLYTMTRTYPGVPEGTKFVALHFQWSGPTKAAVVAKVQAARKLLGHAAEDDAVRVYLDVVDEHIAIFDLAAYYAERHFIDDEFDRGRRDAPTVKAASADLTRVRVALWASVLAAWNEAAGEVPDSPRAIVTRAWGACMHVAESAITVGLGPKTDQQMSACRRAIPTVATIGSFDQTLRATASDVGDFLATGYDWQIGNAGRALDRMTAAYLTLWPTLPTTPAEKP